jgi:hypothetical protein
VTWWLELWERTARTEIVELMWADAIEALVGPPGRSLPDDDRSIADLTNKEKAVAAHIITIGSSHPSPVRNATPHESRSKISPMQFPQGPEQRWSK